MKKSPYFKCLTISILSILIGFLFYDGKLITNTSTGADPFQQDTTQAPQLMLKAESLTRDARYDSARAYYEKAAIIYKQQLDMQDDSLSWVRYVKCLIKIGNNYRLLGRYEKAIGYADSAVTISILHLNFLHPAVAAGYSLIGWVWKDQAIYDEALIYYEKALSIKKEIYEEQDIKVAISYYNMGLIYLELGETDKALACAFKSLAIQKQTFDPNHQNIANIYLIIGNACNIKQDYDNAMEHYQKALSIYKKADGVQHQLVAKCYNNIGRVHWMKGQYDQALQQFQKSLLIKQQIFGGHHLEVAKLYENIGAVYGTKGNYEKALEYFQKTLPVKTAMGNHWDVALSYQNIGAAFEHMGHYEKALQHLQICLNLLSKAKRKNPLKVAEACNNIGKIYCKQNKTKKGLSFFQQALITLADDFGDTNIYVNPSLDQMNPETELLRALDYKAEAMFMSASNQLEQYGYQYHSVIKDLKFSLSTSQLSSRLIDNIRIGYKHEGSKAFLTATKSIPIYEKAIQTALKLYEISDSNQYLANAFQFAEKSKSVLLLETIKASKAKHFAGIPDSLLEKEKALKIDLAFYDHQIREEEYKKESADTTKMALWKDKSFTLKQEYEALIQHFEKKYPKYYELKYNMQTTDASAIQAGLNSNTALIEYFVGDSTLFIFTITANHIAADHFPIDSTFHKTVRLLRSGLTQREVEGSTHKANRQYVANAYALYQLILAPVKKHLQAENETDDQQEINKLVFIRDGLLNYIPFEALLSQPADISNINYQQLAYLIRDYGISYSYSATMLFQQKLTNDLARQKKNEATYIVGFAPSFSSDSNAIDELVTNNFATVTRDTFRDALLPLKGALKEVKNMEKYGDVYTGIEATEKKFKEKAGQFGGLHIASHAIADDRHPMQSRILFSKDEDTTEDGNLYAYELYNMQLNASMTILSACNSGYGKLVRGEGIMSLARAFTYAGCPSIVTSLWSVNDQSTADIMTGFYRGLADYKSKEEALQQAKLAYIMQQAGERAHPLYWSGFVVIGDTSPLILAEKSNEKWWLLMLAAAILSGAFFLIFLGKSLSWQLVSWQETVGLG